jgi:hypothetical protein
MCDHPTPDIDEETGWSRIVTKQIEKSVRIARGLNKASWSIMNVDNEVHVNIGQRNAIEMNSRCIILLIDRKYIDPDKIGAGCHELGWRDENQDKFATLRKFEFATKDAARHLRRLRTCHEMAVRAVSEKKDTIL